MRVPARAPAWIIPSVKLGLVVTDAVAVALSFIAAFYLRDGSPILASTGGAAWSHRFAPYGALLLFVVLIRLLCLRYCDLYRLRGEFSLADDSIKIFKATAIGSLLIVAFAFLYRGGFEFRAFSYARGIFVSIFCWPSSVLVSSDF